jgi:hypothetical protein
MRSLAITGVSRDETETPSPLLDPSPFHNPCANRQTVTRGIDFQLSPWYSRLMNQEKSMTHFQGRHFEAWHVDMVSYDDSYVLYDVCHRYDGRYNVEVTRKDPCGSHIGATETVATFPTSESAIDFISKLVKL